jgi:DNA invertase Pin-like site-specific DNA recombinase
MTTVRCAIYTRKSSEEGLEQDFNSLDAQREACAAYILSQASEGWKLIPAHYDDGGLSGGSLERPALKRLLADVAAGAIDTIVVYKVDRLTRSLLDFSKLVEAFDKASTSFVSVTQSFNTTTSMGRLTLNMLLSFAQFEREVTAERIRDKIAASKAKGMWMGGIPPVGYKPKGRSLEIIPGDAAVVRDIFARYLTTGNVRQLCDALEREGITTPARSTGKGKVFGGVPFSRGQLYAILRNRLYIGEVEHRGSVYPGLHDAIVDQETWDAVQALLSANRQVQHTRPRAEQAARFSGRVKDEDGRPLLAVHASKGSVRYHYYVSKALQQGEGPGVRIPARELDAAIIACVQGALADPFALAAYAGLNLAPDQLGQWMALHDAAAVAHADVASAIVDEVRIGRARIDLSCSSARLAEVLQLEAPANDTRFTLRSDVRLTRSGRVVRLVQKDGAALTHVPDGSLAKLLARAHRWWKILRQGEIDIKRLAALEGVQASYITRVVRLAFLSPAVTASVLDGSAVLSGPLTAIGGLEGEWDKQAADFGVRRRA